MRTYGSIQKSKDGWIIKSLEPHVRIRLKSLFPKIRKTKPPPYVLTGGPELDTDIYWFISRYPLEISEDDVTSLEKGREEFFKSQNEIAQVLSDDWKPSGNCGFKETESPYPFQSQAVELVKKLGRLLVGDEVGLGKTVTALATITSSPDLLPAIVVVQPHLATQWKEKVEEFTTLKSHIIKKTTPYELPNADIYIFKYSNIAKWVDYADQSKFKIVVFDEIQELRHGRSTNKGSGCYEFAKKAKIKLGLTATPIYNYGSEIYNVMQYIEPGCLGSWYEFIREWCYMSGVHQVVEDPKSLGTYLREMNLFIRRTESDVSNQMPPVNKVIHTVPYDEEVASQSEDLAKQLAIQVTSGTFVERGQASRQFDALMRHTTGVAKAKHVAAYAKMFLSNNEPIVLCGWHRECYRVWMEELKEFNPILYTGSETISKKDKAKEKFMSGETNCLIISLRSGAGLDGLQLRSHTVLFGELDWSPQVHYQMIGRLRRPGQKKQVEAHYVVCDGGSDPFIVSTLGLKASQSKGIIDPLKGVDQVYTDSSRIKELAAQFLGKDK